MRATLDSWPHTPACSPARPRTPISSEPSTVPGRPKRATIPPAVSWRKMPEAPRPGRAVVTAMPSAIRRVPISGAAAGTRPTFSGMV